MNEIVTPDGKPLNVSRGADSTKSLTGPTVVFRYPDGEVRLDPTRLCDPAYVDAFDRDRRGRGPAAVDLAPLFDLSDPDQLRAVEYLASRAGGLSYPLAAGGNTVDLLAAVLDRW